MQIHFMKKNILSLVFTLWFGIVAYSQEAITSINLDLIQNEINGGKPLPAEEKFYFRGAIPQDVEMVKLYIYQSKKSPKAGDSYFWKAPFGYKELSFQILVDNPLRSTEEFNLEFGFYKKAGEKELEELRRLIQTNLATYLNTISSVRRGGIKFEDSDEQILSNMDQIVQSGAYYFELPDGKPFPGFSDITRKKLEQRKRLKLGKAKFNIIKKSENENERAVYAQQYLQELETIVFAELDQFLSPNMLVRVDQIQFQNYRREKTPNSIPINFGFGAISLSQDLSSQEFVYSPYLGFSFPLGNRTFTRFMSNLSISTGVFISGSMENSLGEAIRGPVLDRPVFVGLGYNFFRFIRLNAGGTYLTTNKLDGSKADRIQPYVGLSAEINLWLGFGNKK